jgi:CDP-diacylglycerol--glycerol-3-phosphate 3-phosphatidyltransferase
LWYVALNKHFIKRIRAKKNTNPTDCDTFESVTMHPIQTAQLVYFVSRQPNINSALSGFAMLSVYNIKPAFQSLLRPATCLLARRNVTANEVTITAMVLSLVQGISVAWQPTAGLPLLLMPMTLLIRMALNAIDGLLAREHNSESGLGIILNELGDLISDMALYLPLALVPSVSAPLMVIAVCLALMSEATGILAIQISDVRGNEGPMGKSDRAVLFGALAVTLGLRVPGGYWLNGLLVLIVVLLAATILNRVNSALRRATRNRIKGLPGLKDELPKIVNKQQQARMQQVNGSAEACGTMTAQSIGFTLRRGKLMLNDPEG